MPAAGLPVSLQRRELYGQCQGSERGPYSPPQDLLPGQPRVELTAYTGGSWEDRRHRTDKVRVSVRGRCRGGFGWPGGARTTLSTPSKVSFCGWFSGSCCLVYEGQSQGPLPLSGAEDRVSTVGCSSVLPTRLAAGLFLTVETSEVVLEHTKKDPGLHPQRTPCHGVEREQPSTIPAVPPSLGPEV